LKGLNEFYGTLACHAVGYTLSVIQKSDADIIEFLTAVIPAICHLKGTICHVKGIIC